MKQRTQQILKGITSSKFVVTECTKIVKIFEISYKDKNKTKSCVPVTKH